MESETLDERLEAVERAITDGETDVRGFEDAAALRARTDEAEARLAELDERVGELEAAVQALRGYVGSVRAVNRDVERRADAALSKVERAERRRGPDPRTEGDRDGGYRHPIPDVEEDDPGIVDRVASWL